MKNRSPKPTSVRSSEIDLRHALHSSLSKPEDFSLKRAATATFLMLPGCVTTRITPLLYSALIPDMVITTRFELIFVFNDPARHGMPFHRGGNTSFPRFLLRQASPPFAIPEEGAFSARPSFHEYATPEKGWEPLASFSSCTSLSCQHACVLRGKPMTPLQMTLYSESATNHA